VCLICIARICAKLCQRLSPAFSVYKVQETLEAQHGLKHFWTIANRSRESPLKMSIAESNPSPELLNSSLRVLSKPSDTSQDRAIKWSRRLQSENERLIEPSPPECNTRLLGNTRKSGGLCFVPDSEKRHQGVNQLRCGHTEYAGCPTRMKTSTDDGRTDSKPHDERMDPRTDNQRGIAIDKNNIYAAVGQDPMRIVTLRADYRLRPKAQKVISERRRHREFAVVRSYFRRMCAKAHGCPEQLVRLAGFSAIGEVLV
jgi:hypothetical protein